jgi:small-conductance mechanosensitive channel
MTMPLLTTLINDLATDINDRNFVWQVAAVSLCFLFAWLGARRYRASLPQVASQSLVLKAGVESFSRVIFPSLAWIFLLLAQLVLARWHHTNLLHLLIPLIGSLALIRFGFYVFRRIFIREVAAGQFLSVFEKLFASLVWLGLVLYFSGMQQELVDALDNIILPLGRHKVSVLTILQAIASVVVTLVIAMWASAALEARLMLVPTMHSSLKVVLARLGRTSLILIAILVSLSTVGIDLTVLSVFGGALGVGLGFGLQKITSSYVSGFIILFDRSMSIGDMISVDKYSGTITQINTRYTVLKALDGIESVIPNEMLVSNPVQNFSLSDRSLVLNTEVTVDYKTDIEKALALLLEAASSVERVSKETPPSSYLMKFGADGFDLRVSFWISDPENGRTNVVSEVNRAIWKLLKENGIELPHTQRVVTLIDASNKVSLPG